MGEHQLVVGGTAQREAFLGAHLHRLQTHRPRIRKRRRFTAFGGSHIEDQPDVIAGLIADATEKKTAYQNARAAYDRVMQKFPQSPAFPVAVFVAIIVTG